MERTIYTQVSNISYEESYQFKGLDKNFKLPFFTDITISWKEPEHKCRELKERGYTLNYLSAEQNGWVLYDALSKVAMTRVLFCPGCGEKLGDEKGN